MTSCRSGLARAPPGATRISSDMRFHDVADFFWYEVTTARTYVTTGTSNGEGWLTQPRMLAAELKRSVATAECCCSYNMLKLARHLYSWSADAGYFDYYERALLNMRIGTIHPKTGYIHHFVHLNADRAPTPWPKGTAGLKPAGDQLFTTGIEPWGQWGKAPAPGVWHFYSYWQEMKGDGGGKKAS